MRRESVDMIDQAPPAVAPAPDRSLLYIGGGIIAFVVVAALAVVLLGSRDVTTYGADTPEGVVQRQLAAFEDEDFDEAWSYFSGDVQATMPLDEYRRAARDFGHSGGIGSRRILFDASTVDGTEATVRLTVEEYYEGGPFGGGETYRSTRQIALVREDGAWRIDDPIIGLEPGPFDPL